MKQETGRSNPQMSVPITDCQDQPAKLPFEKVMEAGSCNRHQRPRNFTQPATRGGGCFEEREPLLSNEQEKGTPRSRPGAPLRPGARGTQHQMDFTFARGRSGADARWTTRRPVPHPPSLLAGSRRTDARTSTPVSTRGSKRSRARKTRSTPATSSRTARTFRTLTLLTEKATR